MNWIRVAVGIGDDPDVHTLAHHLDISPAEAVGLIVLVLVKFPEHAPHGNLKDVPDTLVERWAGWGGTRGQFAALLRAIFLNPDGVWEAWDKHNGRPLKEAEASRERARKWRTERLENDLRTAYGTAYATENKPHRTLLRTDGRTDQTTGGASHKITPTAYAPGYVNLPTPPFCAECGDGVLVQGSGSRRMVQGHAEGCSLNPVKPLLDSLKGLGGMR